MISFYLVTLHWVDPNSSTPMSMVLDFLNIFIGEGVGICCGEALFLRLKSFASLSSRFVCTISDGASDAIVDARELDKLLCELQSSHILRCIVHTYQLGVKSALEVVLQSNTYKLRKILTSARYTKVKRVMFRRIVVTMPRYSNKMEFHFRDVHTGLKTKRYIHLYSIKSYSGS